MTKFSLQLLWKMVEAAANQEHHDVAEAWCRLCLHPIFEKAGAQNKAKVSRFCCIFRTFGRELTQHRKIIQCAYSRQSYVAAREVHSQMSESGRDEPVTRYLMYKVGLRSGDEDFGMSTRSYS